MGFPKGLTKLTSTGATVTITNPSGPTTNLEVSASAEGITALTGDVTATGPGSSTATLVSTAAVKAIIVAAAPVPGNGYGITGNTGATPTPAVGLAYFTGTATAVALPNNAVTKILDTSSLALGTWLITMTVAVAYAAAALATNYCLVEALVDTATATLLGATTTYITPGSVAGANGSSFPVTLSFVAVVTVAGTLQLECSPSGGSGATGNTAGYTAVRIA